LTTCFNGIDDNCDGLVNCEDLGCGGVEVSGNGARERTGAVAEVGGVNVRAQVRVEGWDRGRLERPCRYITRPPRWPSSA